MDRPAISEALPTIDIILLILGEAIHDFHHAIDKYLAVCEKTGEKPGKPFLGRFVLRIPSELHCAIALAAKKEHKSINAWIADACEEKVS